ncbi:MAG: hypothetical protein R3C28_24660 [Pirellulaceae bacterium]
MKNSSIFNFEAVPLSQLVRHVTRWHLAVFAVCVATVAVASEVKSRWLDFYEPAQEMHYQSLAMQAKDPRLFFLGSSHFMVGVDPRMFPFEVVNLNHQGLDYRLMNLILQKNLARWPDVDAVIIELDPYPLFADTVATFGTNVTLGRLGLDADEYTKSIKSWCSHKLSCLTVFQSPSFSPRSMLERMTPTSVVPGFVSSDLVMQQTGEQRAKFHMNLLKNFNTFGENHAALNEMIHAVQQKGIPCYLVVTPHAEGYWDALSQDVRERYRDVKQDLIAGGKVQVWDLDQDPALQIQTHDFRDGDHLNKSGAQKLTASIIRRVEDSGVCPEVRTARRTP